MCTQHYFQTSSIITRNSDVWRALCTCWTINHQADNEVSVSDNERNMGMQFYQGSCYLKTWPITYLQVCPAAAPPESHIKSETHVGVLKSEHWHKTVRNCYAKRTQKAQNFGYLNFRMDGPTCRLWLSTELAPSCKCYKRHHRWRKESGARWPALPVPSPSYSLPLSSFPPLPPGRSRHPLRLWMWGSA